TVQRDWQVDAGIEPVGEAELLRVRRKAALAVQAVFAGLGFPPITDHEVEAATFAHDSSDVPDRDRVLAERIGGLDVARELDRAGFADVAEAVLGMQRQRVSADYLQTAAIIGPDWTVRSAVNDPNDYRGPGTGYRLEGRRWQLLQSLPHELDPRELEEASERADEFLEELHVASVENGSDDIVVAVGPAFGKELRNTINGLAHADVLDSVCGGIRDGGARPRIVRVRRSSDVAFIGHDGARLSGSGIAVGLQSKGT